MLQEFDQRSTEIGLDSTNSSEHDRKMSLCRAAAENTLVPFTLKKKQKTIRGREILDLLSVKLSPRTSMSVNELPDEVALESLHQTSPLIDFSRYGRAEM